jgi:probable FeS assembly SUF system protein SufT
MSPRYQTVTTTRAVVVERVPDGYPIELQAGVTAQITQALGGSFTLLVHGQLARLAGEDADAIGQARPEGFIAPADARPEDVPALVEQGRRPCHDPEIPVDIVELGLVYACDVEPMGDGRRRVSIRMSLTAPGCGMGEAIADEVRDKVCALPHVGEARVEVVFDPPWDRSRMSEAAALMLGL